MPSPERPSRLAPFASLTWRERLSWASAGALAVALLLHAIGATILAAIWIVLPDGGEALRTDIVWEASREVRPLETVVDTETEQPTEEPTESESSATALQPVALVSMAVPVVVGRLPSEVIEADASRPQAGGEAADGEDGELAGLEGAAGAAAGDFFARDEEERRIVYVIDASGSMRKPFGRHGETRMSRVKQELVSAVADLPADGAFFIVFFNHESHPMPASNLVARGDTFLTRRLLVWSAQLKPGGETKPEAALRQALSLEPDAIFFLTDGKFESRVIDRVSQANEQHIPIHTLGVDTDTVASSLLRAIAHRNGGRFRRVSGTGRRAARSAAAAEAMRSTLQTLRARPPG